MAELDGDSAPMSVPSFASGLGGDASPLDVPAFEETVNTVPPVVSFVTPAAAIAPTDPIELNVTDDGGTFASIVITATYAPSGLVQVIYDGAFTSLYGTSAANVIANGFDFDLLQDPEWWEDVTIDVLAIDTVGNVTTASRTFPVPAGPGAPGASTDTTPPVVDNYDPLPGTTIAATDTISFDVTDDSGSFCSVMITASFPDGSWEVVHTGDAFAPRYAAGSSRTVIANGFRYTCRRAGGWPASPTIVSFPVDAAGNPSV